MFGLPPVTLVTISAAFVFGMILALLGSLKLALAKRLALGEARIGGLMSALSFALIPMMLLSGVLIDQFNVKPVLIGGAIVTALAISSLALPLSYWSALGAAAFAGFGTAAVSTSAMVLMPEAFRAFSHGNEANAVNLGCVFIALGSLVTPALADVLIRTLEFKRTVSILALLCLVPAVLAMLTPDADLHFHEKHADLSNLLNDPSLWLAGLVFLFYAPLESSISTWTTTYLIEKGTTEASAAWLLTAFWTSFMLSRLFIAVLNLEPLWTPGLFLVLPSLLTAVIIGNMSGTASPGSAKMGLLMVGFTLGPIFPTLIGMVFRQFNEARGTAYGAVFAIGSMGSLILSPLIGAFANRRSLQQALRIPMVVALALTAATLVFALTGKK